MVTVVGDPRALLTRLGAGTIIDATTTNSTANAVVTLQSADGPLQVKLPVALPAGTALQLQVNESGDTTQLRLISINGQPSSSPGQTTPLPGTGTNAAPASSQTASSTGTLPTSGLSPASLSPAVISNSPAISVPKGIVATLVSTQIGNTGLPAGSALPTGTIFNVRIVDVQNPVSATAAEQAQTNPLPNQPQANPATDSFTNIQLARQAYSQSTSQISTSPGDAPLPTVAPADGTIATPSATAPATGTVATPPVTTLATGTVATPPVTTPATGTVATPPVTEASNVSTLSSQAIPADPQPQDLSHPSPTSSNITTITLNATTLSNPVTSAPSIEAPQIQSGSPGQPSELSVISDASTPGSELVSGENSGTEEPAPSIPLSTGPTLPQSLTGIVAPNTHAGLPLLQTPLGLLSLATANDLPVGATVTVEPLDEPMLPAGSGTNTSQLTAADPSFEAAVNILRQAAPQAIPLIPLSAPDLSSYLAAALIGLTAAVDTANLRPWLGERLVKQLEKDGHHSLLERLEKGLTTLKSPVQLPISGDWQCLILPLPLGQQIERIRLVYRRPKNEEDEAQEDKGTRFLLDLNMSHLGALQIDGLVQRKSKRFDVILRSHIPLAEDIRRDIMVIFARSLDGMGMVGSASFQRTQTFVEPIPLSLPENSGWVI
jgi:hypothetical protein